MKTKNSNEGIAKRNLKDLLLFTLISYMVIFAISLSLNDFISSLKLSLAYFFFFLLPFLPAISSIELPIIERFLLTNVAGLSYAGLFVLLDVIFKIPLTKTVFFIVSMICLVASLVIYSGSFNSTKQKLHKQ